MGMLFITDIIYKLFVNDTGCQNVKSKAQKTWEKKKKNSKPNEKSKIQKRERKRAKKERRKLTSTLPRAFDDGGNGLGSRWM